MKVICEKCGNEMFPCGFGLMEDGEIGFEFFCGVCKEVLRVV